ncbi:Acetyl-coenzyme A carboxylase carboxyl transferase subunit beta [Chlamydiales bacterium SCGC AG-110-M15]|nr:Acetyl-coenzyme A carboxylase carboxyl transferase subunit beta [Chlamydiales bacterium SCGC AG-110-M15]
MGLFSKQKPKIKVQTTKKDGFSGWLKCTHCKELIHANELKRNINCCPKCDYHYRLSASERIKLLTDKDSFKPLFTDLQTVDHLNFVDSESYPSRLARAKTKSGNDEGVIVGEALIDSQAIALAVMDFNFMGGSMGTVVGERITLIIEHAIEHRLPVVIISASGGARMQESTLSLMQMAKTSAALAKLREQALPFISILTNPTTGGVTASFAALGDVIIAEPQALIGFAGPRVIEQTIGQKLPEGAQMSEFLLEHGMVDCVFKRAELKAKLACILDVIGHAEYEAGAIHKQAKGRDANKRLQASLSELMAMNLGE